MNKKKVLPFLVIIAIASWFIYKNYYVVQSDNDVIYGNVDIREVKPAFRQSGRIEHIYVSDGDQVKKGDLLAALDNEPLQRQVDLSVAKLAVAQAQFSDLSAGPRKQDIESAKQEVARLSATLKNAQYNYARQKNLRKTGATSIGAVDNAQARFNEAKAALASANQHQSLLQEGTKIQTLRIAEQQVMVAKAELAIKKMALADCKLYAPENGVVLTRIFEPGSMVSAANPVLSLSLRDPIYIRAYLNESLLGQVVLGDTVSIYTDSSSQKLTGKIGYISPAAEFTPKSVETTELRTSLVYRVRIVVENDNNVLNQGQPVTIALH